MDNRARVVVIVSSDISDIYFANALLKEVNVVAVVVETQHRATSSKQKFSKLVKGLAHPGALYEKLKKSSASKAYLEKAAKINYEGFGDEGIELREKDGVTVIRTEGVRQINNQKYVDMIRDFKPDIIAVCGASILKDPMISIPAQGILNLHGGLAQKYRGVWTTMWAIYNKEPEYVGATVHHINKNIDEGDIVYQGRPEITPDDNHESLYVKVVKLGIKLMVRAVREIEEGTAPH
ncbi:MAG: formyl transferase, partial [Proteobacteria bacterium]|nr:formyl transferase [Pseudomonadota bacterium]